MRGFDSISLQETETGVVALVGELDCTGDPDVKNHLASIKGDVTVNCAGLSFIDAAGLGILVDARHSCEARGSNFVLAAPPRCLMRLLEITELKGLFDLQIVRTAI